jgi:hypothetical protein
VLNATPVPPETDGSSKGRPPQRGRCLGPILCWAVVFADIGTSVYYTPGILFGQVGARHPPARHRCSHIYVPGIAEPGTLDWLVDDLAPDHVMMLDDGAGLTGADRRTLERHASGTDTILHYRLRAAPGARSGRT